MSTTPEYITADKLVTLVDDAKTSAERFATAVVFVDGVKEHLNLTPIDKLRFYGPFKQTLLGDRTSEKPSALKITARTLWTKWDQMKGKTQEQAIDQYVKEGKDIIAEKKKDIDEHYRKIALTVDQFKEKVAAKLKESEYVAAFKSAQPQVQSPASPSQPSAQPPAKPPILPAFAAAKTAAASGKPVADPAPEAAAAKPSVTTLT